jgi:hypothetical protein
MTSGLRRSTRPVRRALALVVTGGLAATGVIGCTSPMTTEIEIDLAFQDAAPQARAVAACESRMNPNAVSRTDDHGLFQINIVHQASFTRVTGQPWSEIYNVHFNTQFAKWLYDRQGWQPWTCRKVL